jgi:pimeloyl-ACP methyl ester carboxylesterase
VLVHGLGSARTVWKPITAALAKHFDVIAVDLPGHGETPWRAGTPMDPAALAGHVLETVDSLGVKRAHLLGNSLGGWTVVELAAAHPDRVASVVALAPAGMRFKPLAKVHWSFKVNRFLAIATKPLLPFMLPRERLRGLGFSRISPVWKTWSVETCRDAAIAMASSGGYPDALDATVGRWATCTASIPETIPLTILFGDTDTVLPPHTSQSLQHIPLHAQWLMWGNCGHAPQLDYPDRVVELVREVAST